MFNTGVLNQYKQRSFIAFGSGTAIATTAQIPFTIPREARFISFMLIGPGGGGAGGATGAITTSRRGGGAGGSGSITNGIFSTRLLPEVIYLNLAGGGQQGLANASGSASVNSYIALTSAKNTGTTNIILITTSGNAGNVNGNGGTGGAVITTTSLGVVPLAFVGIAGVTGGSSGAALTTPASVISVCLGSSAGAGGSTNLGTPFAGGAIQTASFPGSSPFGSPASTTVISGGANTGAAGINGFHNLDNCQVHADAGTPLFSLPGSGGGAIDSGTGGAGGHGAPGCGGGGGGAGTTGGAGGNGGPSFCIVEWW